MEPIAVDVPVKPAPGSKPPAKDDPAAKKDAKDAPPKPAADAKPADMPKAPPVPGLFGVLTAAAGNITRKQASIAATAVFTAIAGVSGYRLIWPGKPEPTDDTAAVQPLATTPPPPAAKSPPPNPNPPDPTPKRTDPVPPNNNASSGTTGTGGWTNPATPAAQPTGTGGGGFAIPVAPATPPPAGSGGYNIPLAPATTAATGGGYTIPVAPATPPASATTTGSGGYSIPVAPAGAPSVNIERGTGATGGTAPLPPPDLLATPPAQPRGTGTGTGGVASAGGISPPDFAPSVAPASGFVLPKIPDPPVAGGTTPGGTGSLPPPALPPLPGGSPGVPPVPAAPTAPPPAGLDIPPGPASPAMPPSTPPTMPSTLPPIPGAGVSPGSPAPPLGPTSPAGPAAVPGALATPPTSPSPSPGVFPPTAPPGSGTGVRIDSIKPPGGTSVQPVGVSERSPSTSFDVDLHEAKAGETYESISREFYNDAKYARALAAFNQNRPLQNRGPVEVPPVHVLKKQFPQLVGAVAPASGTGTAPNWGAANTPPGPQPDPTFRAAAAKRSYTVPRTGMTLRDVAKEVYGDERRWTELYQENPQITAADEPLRVGAEVKLPAARGQE